MPEQDILNHALNHALAMRRALQHVERAKLLVELVRADMAIAISGLDTAYRELEVIVRTSPLPEVTKEGK